MFAMTAAIATIVIGKEGAAAGPNLRKGGNTKRKRNSKFRVPVSIGSDSLGFLIGLFATWILQGKRFGRRVILVAQVR